MSTNHVKKAVSSKNNRSAMALRENLRRRKEQARLKSVNTEKEPTGEATEKLLDE